MTDLQDRSALAWIRADLDAVIGQARDALGGYAEGSGAPALIAVCVERLHQVWATLQLIELFGASMLTEEMELVARRLQQGDLRQPREAAEALMIALIQLPAYLEKLQEGGRDIPLVILPLMNELRAARDAELLSEAGLPIPGLDLKLAVNPSAPWPESELPEAVRRLRPAYHLALLGWYRDAPSAQGLERLGVILDELEQQAVTVALRYLFRIAGAAVAALAEGSIASGIAIKRLFGRLDGELKRVLADGEAAVAAAPPRVLMKNLLYYIAHADTSHERVAEIKADFDLNTLVPSEGEIAAERAHLSAPGRALLAAFCDALQTELTQIRDVLELFIHGKAERPAGLSELERPLRKVGDTLGIIGQGVLRGRLKGHADRVRELGAAQTLPDEEVLMAIAGDVLYVERALGKLLTGQMMPAVDASMARALAQGLPCEEDSDQDAAVAIQEAGSEIVRIKDAVADFIRSPQDAWILSGLHRHVQMVVGAFRMLNLAEAAELLAGIGSMIEAVMVQTGALPGKAQTEALADAIISIEYYLESVVEGRSDQAEILGLGFAALRRLGWEPAAGAAVIAAAPQQPSVQAPVTPVAEETASREQQPVTSPVEVPPSPPVSEGVSPPAEAPAVPVEEGGVVPAEEQAPVSSAQEAAASAREPLIAWEAAPEQEEIDSGLLDIFIEEAREELAALQQCLPRCGRDPHDEEALARMRRSFHTLKGSGEVVGAHMISDLAGALEQLLDRILDNAVQLSPQIQELLAETLGVLPGLVALQEAGEPPAMDLAPLMQQALELATALPDSAAVAPAEALPVPPQAAGVQAEAAPAVEAAGDARLLTQEQGPAASPSLQAPAEQAPGELSHEQEVAGVFLEEAHELLEALESAFQLWRREPDNPEPVADLQRILHTLKGGARLAGIGPIGDLTHDFESLLAGVRYGQTPISPDLFTLAQYVIDRLVEQVEESRRVGKAGPADELSAALDAWLTGEHGVAPEGLDEALSAEMLQGEQGEEAFEPALADEGLPALTQEQVTATAPAHRDQVRVSLERLDQLVDDVGEAAICRGGLQQQNAQLGLSLGELEQTISRLQDQLRRLEREAEGRLAHSCESAGDGAGESGGDFDHLELERFSQLQQLARALFETADDLASLQAGMEECAKANDVQLQQQSRIMSAIQDQLIQARLVSFGQIVPRLQRVVRQTCRALGKEAALEVSGGEFQLDRGILDRLVAPLEHILRNAVFHGIEAPAERLAANKAPVGRLVLNLEREGASVLIHVSDDGAGLDLARIRSRAQEQGLLDEVATVSDAELMRFIFEPGFSTADEVSQLAGRGVGMDVVANELKALGGVLSTTSEAGQGACFSLRLPMSLAMTEVLLVTAGGERYAVPHAGIEAVVRFPVAEMQSVHGQPPASISYDGSDYEVRCLAALLGSAAATQPELKKSVPLLLMHLAGQRQALRVDGLLGNRHIVAKPLGVQLSTLHWITGGTILDDGSVALILDLPALLEATANRPLRSHPERLPEAASAKTPTVMVVDDSITVRKVTSRLLERQHLNVLCAKDGMDAVALLEQHRPDVLVLDIEMPRMDGFELAQQMRHSESLREIPIVMVSSRSGAKHRERAQALGIEHFLGKPYQEAELLDIVMKLLAGNKP